jgi:hypothetical protein
MAYAPKLEQQEREREREREMHDLVEMDVCVTIQ